MLFVVWWVGLVPISVLFGNVWRELNPWATLARRLRMPATRDRELPHWLGVWPAAGGARGLGLARAACIRRRVNRG